MKVFVFFLEHLNHLFWYDAIAWAKHITSDFSTLPWKAQNGSERLYDWHNNAMKEDPPYLHLLLKRWIFLNSQMKQPENARTLSLQILVGHSKMYCTCSCKSSCMYTEVNVKMNYTYCWLTSGTYCILLHCTKKWSRRLTKHENPLTY